MRSSCDGLRRGRRAPGGWGAPDGDTRRRGISRLPAVDLGGSGTRAWVPGHGLLSGGPVSDDSASRPVRRGRIVDAESCVRLLARIADTALGADLRDSVVVLSRPVLAGQDHRAQAQELPARLGPATAVVLNSAEAAAACAGQAAGGPVPVVDGVIVDARQADTGLTDLEPDALPRRAAIRPVTSVRSAPPPVSTLRHMATIISRTPPASSARPR
ncbi:hypothetical protein OG206_05145 [Streptomyces sp. NBC_01341]|uniref:hypothetical protein n=1 Tax=Streptomyces sp. NBC_01341 TaxID=2903831 RepID=UPI002E0E558C|nr:hypothetical protein OG206_05145 [Streptomyces sp. NBC_01341]